MNTRTHVTGYGDFLDWEHGPVGDALHEGRFWDGHLRPFLQEIPMWSWGIDIGAYIGWFSVHMERRCKTVIAVEAHPHTFQMLCQNIRKRMGIQPVWGAAYDRVTTLSLASAEMTGWETDAALTTNASSLPFAPRMLNTMQVPAFPLDPIVPANAPISFIKIDAQGCDLRALYGLTETIKRCRPVIVFEWEEGYASWHGDTWADVEQWGQLMHYSIERITTDFWDYVARPV